MQISTSGHGWALEQARFERQGGILFLVGKATTDAPGWYRSATSINVPWSQIVFYFATFDTLADYQEAMKGTIRDPRSRVARDWLGRPGSY